MNTMSRVEDFLPKSDLLTIVVPIRADGRDVGNLIDFVRRIPFKVILIRDGSHSDTDIFLDDLANDVGHRITLVKVDVKSPGLARNLGLMCVKTHFVTFYDADDQYPETASIEDFLLSTIRSGADLAAGDFQVVQDSQGAICRSVPKTLSLLLRDQPGIWRFIFRTAFLRENRIEFEALRMGEDVLFLMDCLNANPVYTAHSKVVYTYKIGDPGQATNSESARMHFLMLLERLEARFQSRHSDHDRELISYLWVKTVLYCLIRTNFQLRSRVFLHLNRTMRRNPRLLELSVRNLPRSVKWLAKSRYSKRQVR